MFLVTIGGCGLATDSADGDVADADSAINNEISGSVGDGPIVGASIRIMRNDGQVTAELESTESAGYNITVREKGKFYPLTIDARKGVDLVTNMAPDFVLSGAVVEPSKKSVANISPFSTIAIQLASEFSGGLTKSNINSAESMVTASLSFGLTTLLVSGPMHTPIDSENIAEIVRASEALGETIRRTRDMKISAGQSSSGDAVVGDIASDLIDGVIDGRGGSRVDIRTAAFSTVVAAAVLLESMQNELYVNGADATAMMNGAINQVGGPSVYPSLADLGVTAGMLTSAKVGLDACLAVVPTPKLQELRDALENVQAGATPSAARAIIPDDYRATMDEALALIIAGDDELIATINEVAANGGGELPPTNTAPLISGTPPSEVSVGESYSFTPTATDAEGDPLMFSISGRPSWAQFNTGTGTLSGMPGTADEGTYGNIVISVSDGELSASLPAFSISVIQSNTAPTISGSPPTEVMEGSRYSFVPDAADAEGDPLTFSITGVPGWAGFDTTTGELSGDPVGADVGVYSDIVITVSDPSGASASLDAFSITVNAADSGVGAVTLSWTAPSANEDGSALTDLAGYRIYWGSSVDNLTNSVTLNDPGLTTYVIDNLAAGTYEFVATSFNASGIESTYSNTAIRTVP